MTTKSVAVAWSVEFLPSNPAARVRYPVGSGILISVLGLGVCPLCSVLSCLQRGPDIVLSTHSGLPVLVSTAVAQVLGCALVTQRARVRSPVGTSFLGEVFFGVFSHL